MNSTVPVIAYSLPYLIILAGFAFLIKGADFLVDGASAVAKRFHVSDMLIGLTVVAFGTSTPELAVNLLAATQNTTDIAVGNVVGSNIFNILFVLGISSIIQPLPLRAASNIDIGTVLLATILLFVFMFTGRRHALDRWEGFLFVFFYIGYIGVLVFRA